MYLRPDTKNRFTITPIGTCRLDGPLRLGAERRGVQWQNRRIYGYTHSIAEAVQQVKFLRGEYQPDAALWDVIAKRNLARVRKENHTAADLYLVEISSRKQLFIDDHCVQINHLKSRCAPFFDDVARKTEFWNCLRDGDRAEQTRMVDDFAATDGLSSDQRQILQRLRLTETTDAELERGLRYLKTALGNLVIVTHVDALSSDGDKIPSRSACIAQVVAMAKKLGLAVFNPTSLMNELGQARAIEDESESLAHFTDRFSLALFEAWHRDFLAGHIDRCIQASSTVDDIQKYAANLRACAELDGLDPCADRVERIVTGGHPLSMELRSMMMALYATSGEFDGVKDVAVRAVTDAKINQNLLHYATLSGMQDQDATILRACVTAATENGIETSSPWFGDAVAALCAVDVEGALQVCDTLFEVAPDSAALVLSRTPSLVRQKDPEGILDSLGESGCARVIGLLLSHAEIDPLPHLFRLFTQSAGRFWTAVSVLLANGMHARAETAVRAILASVLSETQRIETTCAKLARNAAECEDSADRLDMLECVLTLCPNQRVAVREMRALYKASLAASRELYANGDIAGLKDLMGFAERVSPRLDHVPYYLSRLYYLDDAIEEAQEAALTATDWAPEKANNWVMLMRASLRLGDPDLGEMAAVKSLETASPEDSRIREEAERRLGLLRRKLVTRAQITDDPWTAMNLLLRASKCPELCQSTTKQVLQRLKVLSDELRRCLIQGDVNAGLDLASRTAPFFAASDEGKKLAVYAFNDADLATVAVPVIRNLSVDDWDGQDQRLRLSCFQGELLEKLNSDEVMALT